MQETLSKDLEVGSAFQQSKGPGRDFLSKEREGTRCGRRRNDAGVEGALTFKAKVGELLSNQGHMAGRVVFHIEGRVVDIGVEDGD